MTEKTERALVTGGCGFIGSHLVKTLVDAGIQVVAVDDMSVGDVGNLLEKGLQFRTVTATLLDNFLQISSLQQYEALVIAADFVDPAVLRYLKSGKFDYVFHLAANPRVAYSVEKPAVTTETNVMKTVELLSTCRGLNLRRFVFASSSAVYGNLLGNAPKNHEAGVTAPNSPYGLQKLVGEMFIRQFSELYGLKATCLRFFNVYGPGAADGSPYMTAITAWCMALRDGKPLRSDGDGEQTRDLVFVEDVAQAMLRFAKAENHPDFVVSNVGTGEAVSNNELLSQLKERFPALQVQSVSERAGDVRHTLASTDLLRFCIDWVPPTTVATGLEKTLTWWKLK